MSKTGKQYEMGQYMTPPGIAQDLIRYIRKPPSDWVVYDPACGEGSLLIAAIQAMKAAGVERIKDRIIGTDIDPEMVAKARINICNELSTSADELLIEKHDFLNNATSPLFSDLFALGKVVNIVLTNPPYAKNREYAFFDRCNELARIGTELLFIMPLSFMDRVIGVECVPLKGKPFGVTTGHCFALHSAGKRYSYQTQKGAQTNSTIFTVNVGAKLYEYGSGTPPQTKDILRMKPYSSSIPIPGWLPCYRTGDIHQFKINPPRLWISYGLHLAHPKNKSLFKGPKLFVRRVPIWKNRRVGAAYTEEDSICAGDVLVVKCLGDDIELLKGLCVFLNSPEAAEKLLRQRPTLEHRDSFPKFSAKDINFLLDSMNGVSFLRNLAEQYPV